MGENAETHKQKLYGERQSKLEVSIEGQESHGKGGGNISKFRRDGGP